MFEYKILGDGLVYYTNLIPSPESIVQNIEKLNQKIVLDIMNGNEKSSILKPWHHWSYDRNGETLIFCKQKWLPRSEEVDSYDPYIEDYHLIADPLFNSLDTAFEHYSTQIYPYASKNIKGREDKMSVLKYENSGYLPEHSDQGSSSRNLSVVLYLNDNYDGGEISFPYVNGGVSIKPEAGSAIFFPSNFVFAHKVSEITNGVRYALPNWYHNMIDKVDTDGTE